MSSETIDRRGVSTFAPLWNKAQIHDATGRYPICEAGRRAFAREPDGTLFSVRTPLEIKDRQKPSRPARHVPSTTIAVIERGHIQAGAGQWC